MTPVLVRRSNIKEIVRAVQELEKRGYECVKPIQRTHKTKKDFLYNDNKNIRGGYEFAGFEEFERFECVMRKVSR